MRGPSILPPLHDSIIILAPCRLFGGFPASAAIVLFSSLGRDMGLPRLFGAEMFNLENRKDEGHSRNEYGVRDIKFQ